MYPTTTRFLLPIPFLQIYFPGYSDFKCHSDCLFQNLIFPATVWSCAFVYFYSFYLLFSWSWEWYVKAKVVKIEYLSNFQPYLVGNSGQDITIISIDEKQTKTLWLLYWQFFFLFPFSFIVNGCSDHLLQGFLFAWRFCFSIAIILTFY